MRLTATLSTLLLTVYATSAQQLTKEIVVEREIEPAERAAARPASVWPVLYAPTVQQQRLLMGEYTGTGTLSRIICPLEPASWRDTLAVSPYRGYVSGGYFPTFNAGISAGYRIVSRPGMLGDVWLQYNGYSYKYTGQSNDAQSHKYNPRQQSFRAGFGLQGAVGKYGTMQGDASVMMSNVRNPLINDGFDQTAMQAVLNIGWTASAKKMPWYLRARFEHFSFDKVTPESYLAYYKGDLSAPSENVIKLGGGVGTSGKGALRLDVDARFQSLNQSSHYLEFYPRMIGDVNPPTMVKANDLNVGFVTGKGTTLGIISLRPAYTFAGDNTNVRLGADVDVCTGAGNGSVYVAPDVRVSWEPTSMFAAWLRATGGKELNTLSSVFQYSPFVSSASTYGTTSVPLDAMAGFNVGPIKGLSFSAKIGYARAKDVLLPVSTVAYINTMSAQTVKGVRYGVRLDWDYFRVFSAYVSVEGAPGKDEHGYYKWRDHASTVVEAGATIRPVARLSIDLSWQMRTGRRYMEYRYSAADPNFTWCDLGDVKNLNIGAEYRVTEPFTAFARVENLLGQKWCDIPLLRAPGVHGLLGVSYKF